MLLSTDGHKGSWQSIYTIEAVTRKVRQTTASDTRLRWIFAVVNARVLDEDHEPGEVSFRQFPGKGQPNNRGTCDLLMRKYLCKDRLLNVEIEKLTCPEDERQQLIMKLVSHEAFLETKKESDIWLGILSLQARLFF